MPSPMVDQTTISPSSYFLDEIPPPPPPQRQNAGFWNPESMLHNQGSKSVPSPSLDKLAARRAQAMGFLESSQPSLLRDEMAKLNLEQQVAEAERTTNLPTTSWRAVGHGLRPRSNVFMQPTPYFTDSNKINMEGQYENGLFSSSLSDIFTKKLRIPSNGDYFGQSVNAATLNCDDEEPLESLEQIEAQTIGNLLPDEEDLLSGVKYNPKYIGQANIGDDIEDFDLFSSGGGMELGENDDFGSSQSLRNSDFSGTNSNGQQEGSSSSLSGQGPHSEQPSRTLIVRNVNSNNEDSELRALFEQYGDIRTLYTACKHRGFVMISYYDIRAACDAIRALQNKPLRCRNLDIHFLTPKDNSSENDINQGTLVVFNPDYTISNNELHQTFGVYGEIKEINENPYKLHHNFIEFYDIRAAEAAHCALNKSDIAGKQIKIEPSYTGSMRRSVQLSSPEIVQGGSIPYLQRGSPPNSASGCFGPVLHGAITSNGMENESAQGIRSSMGIGVPINRFVENGFHHNLPPSVPQRSPSSISNTSAGVRSGLVDPSFTMGKMEFDLQQRPPFHPHSLPEYHDGLACAVPYDSPGTMAANISSIPRERISNGHIHRVSLNGHPVEPNDGVFGSGNGSCPLHGQQYMWSNGNSYQSRPPNPLMWSTSPSFVNSVHGHSSQQLHGLPRTSSHMLNAVLPMQHHHVGSAPTANPSLWGRRHIYEGESQEPNGFHPGSLGSTGLPSHLSQHHFDLNCNIYPHGGGSCMDLPMASASVGLHSPQQGYHMLPRRNSMVHMPNSFDGSNERVISRRSEITSSPFDGKKQYDLDIDLILRGEDTRTTLMIKNIPNKYTSKMLLAAIDEHHRGTYDFIYLPIDFKNKCNVGYAFINMIDPTQIVPFYQAFNGKKWEKFNSEKVASLAYARIQGKAALIAHFQNSSLMNEDKRCRPILFHTDGPNAGDQEPFPMGVNIRSRPGKTRTNSSEDNHQGSQPTTENIEQASNITDFYSGSARDSE